MQSSAAELPVTSSAAARTAGLPVSHHASSDATLDGAVASLLADAKFKALGRRNDRREMIAKANSIGGPPLRLIPLSHIEQTGKLPHSSENVAQDAVQLIAANDQPGQQQAGWAGTNPTEIYFFSHRWLRPSHPDDDSNTKAKALIEFGRWRTAWVQERYNFTPRIYLWLDVACVDQAAPGPDLAKLPLAIACCERMLTFAAGDGTSAYAARGWCRLEQLLARRFSYADHQVVVGAGYVNAWPDKGTQRKWTLSDPAAGALSVEADRIHLAKLTRLALARPRGEEEDEDDSDEEEGLALDGSSSALTVYDLT